MSDTCNQCAAPMSAWRYAGAVEQPARTRAPWSDCKSPPRRVTRRLLLCCGEQERARPQSWFVRKP